MICVSAWICSDTLIASKRIQNTPMSFPWYKISFLLNIPYNIYLLFFWQSTWRIGYISFKSWKSPIIKINSSKNVLWFLFYFLRQDFFLCSPGCPGTCLVAQAGLEFQRAACLWLLSARVKSMSFHQSRMSCESL